MKKLIKALSLIAIVLATFIANVFININANASLTLAATTNVTLESEYISDTSIRYISVINGLDDADDITKTIVYFKMGLGDSVLNSNKEVTDLYKSVSDKYPEKDGVLYQVVTLNSVDYYTEYTLNVYFEYTFSDNSKSTTNTCTDLLLNHSRMLQSEVVCDEFFGEKFYYAAVVFPMDELDVNLFYKDHNGYNWYRAELIYDEYSDTEYIAYFGMLPGNFYDLKIATFNGTYYSSAQIPAEEEAGVVLDFSTNPLENVNAYNNIVLSKDELWSAYGVNNANNSWGFVRLGGKNNTNSEAYFETTSAIASVSKVVINVSRELEDTYTDITIEATKAGSDTITVTKRVNPGFSGDLVFDNNGFDFGANCIYKITFNAVNSTGTNGALEINSIKLLPHSHNYIIQNVDAKYLAETQDCTHGDIYYYSCECGEHGAETFEVGTGNGHDYELTNTYNPTKLNGGYYEYTCKHCGDVIAEDIDPLGYEYPNTEYDEDITEIVDLLEICSKLSKGSTSSDYYYARGIICESVNSTYGNCAIVDENGNSITIYGMYDHTGAIRYDSLQNQPQYDDFVILYGQVKNYNGTYEMVNARLYWLNDDDMTNSVVTPGNYSLTINEISSGTYSTGNYGSLKNNGYEFIYYRTYNNSLLDNDGYYYDSLEGAFYNASAIKDISKITFTYSSSQSFKLLYGEDYINYLSITVPSGSSKTVTYELNDADYFKIQTDSCDVTLTSIIVNYQYRGTEYPTYKAVEGKRINPIVYTNSLVPGSSYVDVPIDVTYNKNGTYEINKTKRYTYYTLEYVKNNPSAANSAAMLDPMDVINYYIAFNTFPANYVYPKKSNYNSSNYNSYSDLTTCISVFGNKTRGISYYTRIDGYAEAIPGVNASAGYYELDIDLDGSYSTSSRGVGRVVIWTAGIDHTGYNDSPVCVYTDDHYISFMEYLNDGTYSNRFCAEELVTGYKYSDTSFPTTYEN